MAPPACRTWCLLAALVFLGVAPAAKSWGRDGHKITARVAQALLSPTEMQQVGSILGEGISLASVANWPDEELHKIPWSQALHFVNAPDGQCSFDYGRDCKDEGGILDRCVAGAILNYTERLVTSQDPGMKEEALKFLVHFVGDIHQPLHVAWTSDRGGNKVRVEEGWEHDKHVNLHQVWDFGIIESLKDSTGMSEEEIAQNLTKELHGDMSTDFKLWSGCLSSAEGSLKNCVEHIASESIEDACAFAYKDDKGQEVRQGEDLDEAYFKTRAVVVISRLAAGGVRLAAFLKYALKASAAEELLV